MEASDLQGNKKFGDQSPAKPWNCKLLLSPGEQKREAIPHFTYRLW